MGKYNIHDYDDMQVVAGGNKSINCSQHDNNDCTAHVFTG